VAASRPLAQEVFIGFPASRASPRSTLKTRDSARAVGALARVLWDRPTSPFRVERVQRISKWISRLRMDRCADARRKRRGTDRQPSHRSCAVMICGRPRVSKTGARTQLRASVWTEAVVRCAGRRTTARGGPVAAFRSSEHRTFANFALRPLPVLRNLAAKQTLLIVKRSSPSQC